jgi:hypothetical protein
MAGPVPTDQPTCTADQVAICQALIRRQTAPQAQVSRAKVALLRHADPPRNHVAAGQRLGQHENGVR